MSVTTLKLENLLISEFQSKDELRDALSCSCHLPFFAGRTIPTLRGVKYLDGGLTNQMPVLNEATVLISPFSGQYKHICPEDKANFSLNFAKENVFVNKENVFRGLDAVRFMDENKMSLYYKLGYEQTARFLEKTSFS